MPAVAGNAIGLNWGWSVGENGWKAGMDSNLQLLELLVQPNVFDRDIGTPPGSPAIGDRYLLPGSGLSGAWAGHANKLVAWNGTDWVKIAPLEGWRVYVADEDVWLQYSGSNWLQSPEFSRPLKSIEDDDYTLVAADAGAFLELTDDTEVVLHIPANASVAFPAGTEIVVAQAGAGAVTFTPAGGVTLQSLSGADQTAGQHGVAALRKVATNTWRLYGDIA